MGAAVALEFAGFDASGYDYDTPTYGPLKLGEFVVKGVVLLSPEWSFKNVLSLGHVASLCRVQHNIAVMILVGEQDGEALKKAYRVYSLFERHHPEPAGKDRLDKRTLFFIRRDTGLQGTKLLDPEAQRAGHHRGLRPQPPGQQRRIRATGSGEAQTSARIAADSLRPSAAFKTDICRRIGLLQSIT